MGFNRNAVAQRAIRLRKAYDIDTYGIPDIFSFVNQQYIELIRYPFGVGKILGFSMKYREKTIIVSNSSEILTREIYTIAHELGHVLYDLANDSTQIQIDKQKAEYTNNIAEKRAYYFADCLLMPEDELRRVSNPTDKSGGL